MNEILFITREEQLAFTLADEWLRIEMFADPNVWTKVTDYVFSSEAFDAEEESIPVVISGIEKLKQSGKWINRTDGEEMGDRGRSGPKLLDKCDALIARAALGPAQGTSEWKLERQFHINGTELSKVLGTNAARNSIIYSKCDTDGIVFSDDQILLDGARGHGHKFEPLSCRIYELTYGVTVVPLQYVIHPTTPFLAASPDGLVYKSPSLLLPPVDESSTPSLVEKHGKLMRGVSRVQSTHAHEYKIGRLVEFKNPIHGYRGELEEEPKKDWWIQTQMQMEVCDLEEVDFVATLFKEVTMNTLLHPDFGGKSPARGAIVQFGRVPVRVIKLDEDGKSLVDKEDKLPDQIYKYQEPILLDDGLTSEEIQDSIKYFVKSTMNACEAQGYFHVSTTYWYLEDMCCNLVPRNREWFASVLPALEDTWNTVEAEKKNGAWTNRAPKRKATASDEHVLLL